MIETDDAFSPVELKFSRCLSSPTGLSQMSYESLEYWRITGGKQMLDQD